MNDTPAVFLIGDDADIFEPLAEISSQLTNFIVRYSHATQFFNNADLDRSGCVISDIAGADLDAWEIMRRLDSAGSPLSYIVATRSTDMPTAVALMESGVMTVMEIPYDKPLLLQRIERAMHASQKRWLERMRMKDVQQRIDSLSREERTIMHMMLADEPNKAIARALQISMRTVDRRRQTVLETMRTANIPQLAILLCEVGLLPTSVVGHKDT